MYVSLVEISRVLLSLYDSNQLVILFVNRKALSRLSSSSSSYLLIRRNRMEIEIGSNWIASTALAFPTVDSIQFALSNSQKQLNLCYRRRHSCKLADSVTRWWWKSGQCVGKHMLTHGRQSSVLINSVYLFQCDKCCISVRPSYCGRSLWTGFIVTTSSNHHNMIFKKYQNDDKIIQ